MVTAGLLLAALAGGSGACGRGSEPPSATTGAVPGPRPSILLVTLDTTRADAIGPDASGVTTPSFNAIAARGRRFRQAYATVPETLPSHASMMTGLYPAGHGIHENARRAAPTRRHCWPSACEAPATGRPPSCRASSWRGGSAWPAASTSSTTSCLRGGRNAPPARRPTPRSRRSAGATRPPLFLWVHYWDPHHPYTPPEPFRSAYPSRPYLGEVAYMDAELGRLIEAFERRADGPAAIILVGDHGEGLGDHGEAQHGHLLYQSTMRVPARRGGPGRGVRDERRAGEHPPRLSHGARPGRRRVGRQPAGRVDGRGARRGDEAVSRVRLAAADHGGAGQAEGHLRRRDRTLRRRRRPGRGTRPLRGRRPPRGDARRPRRLPGAVARGGAGSCRARAPRTGRRSPAWAT